METRQLGRTGLEVTPLGLGLAEISRRERSGEDVPAAARVLQTALDAGINFLDTAPCYADTEELIGRTVAHRRDEYVLATKCGHVAGEASGEPWTAPTIEHSIDRSLRRLRTDRLDLVQIHSCSVEVLERGEVIEALVKARDAGKTRFIGYSGDNEAARWAIDSGAFDTLQTSFNLVEQRSRTLLLEPAEAKGMGIIIKRPVANGAWGKDHSPSSYADEYFRRAQVMAGLGPVPEAPGDPVLLAMGFVFAHPQVDTAIVGTHNPDHVVSNIDLVEHHLPISSAAVEELHRRFDQVGQEWPGVT